MVWFYVNDVYALCVCMCLSLNMYKNIVKQKEPVPRGAPNGMLQVPVNVFIYVSMCMCVRICICASVSVCVFSVYMCVHITDFYSPLQRNFFFFPETDVRPSFL